MDLSDMPDLGDVTDQVMIVWAMLYGSNAAATDKASLAIKDAYHRLKSLMQKRFKGNKSAEEALDEAVKYPHSSEKTLMKAIAENNLDKDKEILESTRKLLDLINKEMSKRK